MSKDQGTSDAQATETTYSGEYCFYQGHYYPPGTERCMVDQSTGDSRIFMCVSGQWEGTGEACEISFDAGSSREAGRVTGRTQSPNGGARPAVNAVKRTKQAKKRNTTNT